VRYIITNQRLPNTNDVDNNDYSSTGSFVDDMMQDEDISSLTHT